MIEEGGVFWTPDRAKPGVALLRDGDRWLEFSDPIETRVASSLDEVVPLLEWAESAAESNWVVGHLAYDAAPALDSALVAIRSDRPLGSFSTYRLARSFKYCAQGSLYWANPRLSLDVTRGQYFDRLARVREHIAEGRTYQVNLTHRLAGTINSDAGEIFCALVEPYAPDHGALIVMEDGAILSLSPELFFQRDGQEVTCQPMKGTRPADWGDSEELASHPKDRAENLMIVDMIRNDVGRIAEPGSIKADDMFVVQVNGSVLQMTSTVRAKVTSSTLDIFRALFPCSSVVGAPKVETSRVIAELETSSRGVYCGAIGWMAPGRKAKFNVAIRTLVIEGKSAEYGVGSGIVWDSEPQSEWEECKAKTVALDPIRKSWNLLETARLVPKEGLLLAEEHRERMLASARELKRKLPADHLEAYVSLERWLADPWHRDASMLVRIQATPRGEVSALMEPYKKGPKILRASVCPWPVWSGNLLLRHKTTRRLIYERALASQPSANEVILWNERGELTEFTFGNLVLKLDGDFWTPPVSCGLLPGIQRAVELESGKIREKILTKEDLLRSEEVWHINSVRGWTAIKLIN